MAFHKTEFPFLSISDCMYLNGSSEGGAGLFSCILNDLKSTLTYGA